MIEPKPFRGQLAAARDVARQRVENHNATMMERYGCLSIGQATKNIPMIVSPWYRDEADGCMTRTVRAAD